MLPDEFGALVRVFLAAEDPAVEEVATADGHPAWRLQVKAIPNGILPPELTGDAFTITVDKETGMPVEVFPSGRPRWAWPWKTTSQR